MEVRTVPAIHTILDKPPAESPPSLESTTHHEDDQWIEDATTSAESMLNTMDTHHATNLCKEG